MKKRRTRQHIIEDISRNYFERFVVELGHTVETNKHDYGYDLNLYSYDLSTNGEVENGWSVIQLKATDNLKVLKDGRTASFEIEKRDLELWIKEIFPAFLVVYDANDKKAYWIYIQAYFTSKSGFDINKNGKSITIHFDMVNDLLTDRSIKSMIYYKNKISEKLGGKIHHEI